MVTRPATLLAALLLGTSVFAPAGIGGCGDGANASAPSPGAASPNAGVATGDANGDGEEASGETAPDPAPARPAPQLGSGDHSPQSVTFVEVANASNCLRTPRDLAFNPRRPDELWIVNYADDSVTIVSDASLDTRKAERRKDGYAVHFMAEPSSIAFGQDETTFGLPGTFATCGESRNTYDGQGEINDFMGPVLWSSDLTIFAKKNPNRLGSHLDMLHNSPLCMGIAHEEGNRYWVFNGLRGSLDSYDFAIDDGIGNDDHSDGKALQYATGKVKYQKGVPSHLAINPADKWLYAADTGNSRIVKLDPKSGKLGKRIPPKEPMALSAEMDGATLLDVVTKESQLLTAPSGLEINGELLFVSDNATGRITAFTTAGEAVNYLDTGLPAGALSGMAFGPDGKLYFVDMKGNRVLRIDVPAN